MPHASQPTVWVLVADGAHARIVVPAEREGLFSTLIAFDPNRCGERRDARRTCLIAQKASNPLGHEAFLPAPYRRGCPDLC